MHAPESCARGAATKYQAHDSGACILSCPKEHMNIRGVDQVVLGVDEMDAAQRFLRDFGLTEIEKGANGATFEALDGTNLVLRDAADRALPMAVGAATNAREIVWGVDSAEELQKIGAELSKDRQVSMGSDGVLRTNDDTGYAHRVSGDDAPRLRRAGRRWSTRPGSRRQRAPTTSASTFRRRIAAQPRTYRALCARSRPRA